MKTLHTLNTTNDLTFINSEPYRSMQKTINSVTQPLLESTSKLQDQLRPIREIAKQIKKASSLNRYPELNKIQNEMYPMKFNQSIAGPYNLYNNSFKHTLNNYGIQNIIATINKNMPYLNNGIGINSALNSINKSLRNYVSNASNNYEFKEELNQNELSNELNLAKQIDNNTLQSQLNKLESAIGSPKGIISKLQINNAKQIVINLSNDEIKINYDDKSNKQSWNIVFLIIIPACEYLIEQNVTSEVLNLFIIILFGCIQYKITK